MLAEIDQKAFALAYHGHQAAVGGKVLLVLLEVLRNVVDPFRQQSYLTLDGAGVLCVTAEFGEDP